ncbi:hypothetical protein N658DRAFT_78838 [Parathielavia hyrcaniae]|uniref:Uncharacterized protein n=1 Tax=Parathielavia hyrcaniae TaxID=113614 RepID=A0AAN6T1X9_9PEZI|nr:hypothetical protein N658DRAFT_78838 [Parathielavia hyrcaniae]
MPKLTAQPHRFRAEWKMAFISEPLTLLQPLVLCLVHEPLMPFQPQRLARVLAHAAVWEAADPAIPSPQFLPLSSLGQVSVHHARKQSRRHSKNMREPTGAKNQHLSLSLSLSLS